MSFPFATLTWVYYFRGAKVNRIVDIFVSFVSEIVAVERGRTEFFMQQNANIRSGPGGQEQRVEGKLMTSNNSLMSSRSQQPLQKKQSGTQSPPLALQLPPLNGNNAGQLQNQTNNNINGSLANKNSSKANNVARKISNKTTGMLTEGLLNFLGTYDRT